MFKFMKFNHTFIIQFKSAILFFPFKHGGRESGNSLLSMQFWRQKQ